MKLLSSKKINRRLFLKNGFRLSALAFLGIGFESRDNLRIERVSLGFTNLPDSFHGFRIVQVSDLHASFWVGRDYLMQMVRKINKMEKDLVVITHHFIPIKDPVRYQAGLIKEPYGYTYVNRGIGTLVFPFRVAAPPEITCITLQKYGLV